MSSWLNLIIILKLYDHEILINFAGMKILISGYSGLLGSELLMLLSEKKVQLFLIGRKKLVKNKNIVFIETNLAEKIDFQKFPKKIDVVIHIAQSPYFRDFNNFAQDIYAVNTSATFQLALYAKMAGAKQFIFTSTAGIYSSKNEPITEGEVINYKVDQGFYIASKLAAEQLLINFKQFYNIIIFRPFFIYGPLQDKNMLIPRLINNVKNHDRIDLKGSDGLHINPIYVRDAAKALMAAIGKEESSIYNLAGPEVVSLRSIADMIGVQCGEIPTFNVVEPKMTESLVGNIDLLSKNLYKPEITFKEGLKTFFE